MVVSSPISRGVLHEQMSNWEMSMRVAETPKQALDFLAQAAARSVPFDLAVIDLGAVGVDPLELAHAIRTRPDIAKVRLVMLTRRYADSRAARQAGYDACLVKPLRQTVLYECLVNVMAGRPQETLAAPVVAAPVARPAPAPGGSILVVEDNLINQQVALGILEIQGYRVTLANNGREALEAHAHGS